MQDSASGRTQSGVSVQPEPTEAFEAVVRRAGPAMLAYARRRVDPDTAEDVVAEALLVLWRDAPRCPGPTGRTGVPTRSPGRSASPVAAWPTPGARLDVT